MPCFLLDERDWKAALYCGLFSPRYTLDTLGLRDVLYHFLGCCHLWWFLLWSVITPKPSSSSSFSLPSEHRNSFFFLKSFDWFFCLTQEQKVSSNLSIFTTYDVYQPGGHISDIIFLFWWLKTFRRHPPKSLLSPAGESWTFTAGYSKADPNHWVQMKAR